MNNLRHKKLTKLYNVWIKYTDSQDDDEFVELSKKNGFSKKEINEFLDEYR